MVVTWVSRDPQRSRDHPVSSNSSLSSTKRFWSCPFCIFSFVCRRKFKDRDKSLEYLTGIVTDLFVDWNRIQGTDMRHRIPQLQAVVMANDFNQIIKFFNLK
jgi:hypothetical protein